MRFDRKQRLLEGSALAEGRAGKDRIPETEPYAPELAGHKNPTA